MDTSTAEPAVLACLYETQLQGAFPAPFTYDDITAGTTVTVNMASIVAGRLAELGSSGQVHPETVDGLLDLAATDPAAAASLYGIALGGVRNDEANDVFDFSLATGFGDNDQDGGNCATFVTSALMHVGFVPFGAEDPTNGAGWVPSPTERTWVNGADYRFWAGGDGVRVAPNLFAALTAPNPTWTLEPGSPVGTIIGAQGDDGEPNAPVDLAALRPGDLMFTLFEPTDAQRATRRTTDPNDPSPDHVSMVVGFGPSIFDPNRSPQPPLFTTYAAAVDYWSDPANDFESAFGRPFSEDLVVPYGVDHGGPRWSDEPAGEMPIPRPYDDTRASRANFNDDRVVYFVRVDPYEA